MNSPPKSTPLTAEVKQKDNLLNEVGIVVLVDSEFAYIQTQRQAGCSNCANTSGCGTSALATLFNRSSRSPIKVLNILKVKVGEQVTLTLDESRLLKHSFMAYGLPLLGLFIFAISFKYIAIHFFAVAETSADIVSIISGFIGMVAGWIFTHKMYDPILPEISQIHEQNENIHGL